MSEHTIRAVLLDLGGAVFESPMAGFAQYEATGQGCRKG
jgi:hypothetical protein